MHSILSGFIVRAMIWIWELYDRGGIWPTSIGTYLVASTHRRPMVRIFSMYPST